MYGITPQESLADTDQESRKRDSPSLNQTVIKMGDKQGKLALKTEEVATPLKQFTQNIMGTSVVTVKPKMKTIQTKTFTQQSLTSCLQQYPMYYGNDDEDFDEWADQLEALCEIS